jgi:hypothetical protein
MADAIVRTVGQSLVESTTRASLRQILLILEILVGRDEDVESGVFGDAK